MEGELEDTHVNKWKSVLLGIEKDYEKTPFEVLGAGSVIWIE